MKNLDAALIGKRLTKAMARAGIGSRILEKRIRARWGEIRGSSYGAIEAYRKGSVRRPRLEVLRATAEILEVRSEWLIWGEGEMTSAAERIAAANRSGYPGKDDNPTGFLLTRIDREFPEAELIQQHAPEAWALVATALLQFTEGTPPESLQQDGTIDPTTWDMFWMGLRQAVVCPLLMWALPDGPAVSGDSWEAGLSRIEWSSRRVRNYLIAALGAFIQAIPERREGPAIMHTYVRAVATEDRQQR